MESSTKTTEIQEGVSLNPDATVGPKSGKLSLTVVKKRSLLFENMRTMLRKNSDTVTARKRVPEREEKKKKLNELLDEETRLRTYLEGLKQSICEANKDIRGKEETVARLTRRLAKLNVGGASLIQDPGEGNGVIALSIFPREIWEMVLGNINDPKDMWNCSNTCQVFGEILHDWKSPTWLFKEALPYLFQYLPGNQVLKCRLVSKGWNEVVDRFLGNHPSLRPEGKVRCDPRVLPFVNPMREKNLYSVFTSSPPRRRDLLSSLINHRLPGRNSLIGRAVHLDIWNCPWYDLFTGSSGKVRWEAINVFLEIFGKDIWYLTVNSSKNDLKCDDQEKMYQFITTDLFLLVPDLRKLCIQSSVYEHYRHVSTYPTFVPHAPKLETIESDHDVYGSDNHPVLFLLRSYHAQLQALYLKVNVWEKVYFLGWSNLVELHLDKMGLREDYERLLEVDMPNLRKLGVNMDGGYDWSFDMLLNVVNKLSSSTRLDMLRLYGKGLGLGSRYFKGIRSQLCMPATLKTLELEYFGTDAYSFLILLRFPLLENLHVFWREKYITVGRCYRAPRIGFNWNIMNEIDLLSREDYEKAKVRECNDGVHEIEHVLLGAEDLFNVKQYLFNGKMYQSNIWELLARLKLFTFQRDVYTRDGYEQFKAKKERFQASNLK